MKDIPHFYCDICGLPVSPREKSCPHCGGEFTGVRCPSCDFMGGEASFTRGCPSCGFLSHPKGADGGPSNPSQRGVKAPLPRRLYNFLVLGLLILLGAFLARLAFRILLSQP